MYMLSWMLSCGGVSRVVLHGAGFRALEFCKKFQPALKKRTEKLLERLLSRKSLRIIFSRNHLKFHFFLNNVFSWRG